MDLSVLYGYYDTFDVLFAAGFRPVVDPQKLLMTSLQIRHWVTSGRLVDKRLAVITDEMLRDAPRKDVIDWLTANSQKQVDIETAIARGLPDVLRERLKDPEQLVRLRPFSWLKYLDVLRSTTDGHLQVVQVLVDQGVADPLEEIAVVVPLEKTVESSDYKDGTQLAVPTDPDTTWPLLLACEKGNKALFHYLAAKVDSAYLNVRAARRAMTQWWNCYWPPARGSTCTIASEIAPSSCAQGTARTGSSICYWGTWSGTTIPSPPRWPSRRSRRSTATPHC
jgi:hypothetical protein